MSFKGHPFLHVTLFLQNLHIKYVQQVNTCLLV